MAAHTRRDFLATTLRGVIGTSIGATISASVVKADPLDRRRDIGARTAQELLPDTLSPFSLRDLAAAALDAARAAGVSYADVRVSDTQRLRVRQGRWHDIDADTEVISNYTYGLRVIVDGTWAFVYGNIASPDAMARSANNAVGMARGYSRLTKHRVELADAPVIEGEWTTPAKVDPFAVPLRDHVALIGAIGSAVEHLPDAVLARFPTLAWGRETRVFASTEGTMLTQIIKTADPFIHLFGTRGIGLGMEVALDFKIPGIIPSSVGYEGIATQTIQNEAMRVADETVRLAGLPRGTLDVGRYPVVFDGMTLGAVLSQTLGGALESDRVLGYETSGSGSSFLSPPEQALGSMVASPVLNVLSSRSVPSIAAVKWDDEGVEAHDFPLIQSGRLVDYCTSRQTAKALSAWYAQRGVPVRSHGCAVVAGADTPVQVRAAHLSVAPSTTKASVDDLCRGIAHGVLVRQGRALATDHQFASGSFTKWAALLEIKNGKPVRRLYGNGLQFSTGAFWKGLTGVGDAGTVATSTFNLYKGEPWHAVTHSATAPAGLFKQVDVIATRIRI
jgi:TldD protein